MLKLFSKLLAFSVMSISASTSFATLDTLSTTLPTPYLSPGAPTNTNYLMTNLTFRSGIVNTGFDPAQDLIPYFYLSASDTFSYDGHTCTGGRGGGTCFPHNLSYTYSAPQVIGIPNVFHPGDQLDANFHFSLYQAQTLSFTVTTPNGLGAPALHLWDATNNLVTPDNTGNYALLGGGSGYNLEFMGTYNTSSDTATIIGTAAAATAAAPAPTSPVPEPATAWLFVSGLIGVAGAICKRKSV